MSEIASQIFQALSSRLRSPFVGYFILSQMYLNYSAFFLLFWGSGSMEWRITVFEVNSSFGQFVVVPAFFALVGGIGAPWVTYFGAWVAKWPSEKLKKLQMSEARKLRIHDYNQAAEELQAEAEFNSNKVAVAESLKRAEEVGGEELLEDIKAGPSSMHTGEKSSETEDNNLYVESGYVASKSTGGEADTEDAPQPPSKISANIMDFFEDFWNLTLPELITQIPENSAGRVVELVVTTIAHDHFSWDLRFQNGDAVGIGSSERREQTPQRLTQAIAAGIFSSLDDERLRVSPDLHDLKLSADEWLSKRAKE